jgi:hypothetical protein
MDVTSRILVSKSTLWMRGVRDSAGDAGQLAREPALPTASGRKSVGGRQAKAVPPSGQTVHF